MEEQANLNTESIEDVQEEDTESSQKNDQALKNAYIRTKEKLGQYRDKAAELEKKLKEYEQTLGDASPDQIRKWKQASEDFQAAIAKKEQNFEKAISLREAQLAEAQAERDALQKENVEMRITTQLEAAFYEARGKKGHFAVLKPHLMSIAQLNEANQLELYPNGALRLDKNGQPKPSSEVIAEEFAQSELWGTHFEPVNNAMGGGMQRSESVLKNSNVALNELAPSQRREMARRKGITQ
jgi:multidrug efflux pump subunit AcrA (membrane-fusion protein)